MGMAPETDPAEIAKGHNLRYAIVAAGAVICALLSALFAKRAATLQARGQTLPSIGVK